MSSRFTLTGAVDNDPAIDHWLSRHDGVLAAIAQRWFRFMRDRGPDVRELMHDGQPTVCVGDAPFCYVAIFQAHVNVGFFDGATLPDPDYLLQGTGRRMRHVKLVPGRLPEADSLERLVNAAYDAVRGHNA